MEDTSANDETASASYGPVRRSDMGWPNVVRPNLQRADGRTEEQVRTLEETLLQAPPGGRSYEVEAVDPNTLQRQLQALQLERLRAEYPTPSG